MYLQSTFTKPIYSIGDVAELLGVSTQTIRCYEREGKLQMVRSDGGHRRITRENLLAFLEKKHLLVKDKKRDVIYACPSFHCGILAWQIAFITEQVKDLQTPLVIRDTKQASDCTRTGIQRLIRMVLHDEVNRIFVVDKHVLADHGYEYLEFVFREKGVAICEIKGKEGE